MMTRKNYKEIAAILESVKGEMTPSLHFTLVDMFAEMLKKDNPNFQEARFFDASGSAL